MGSASRRLAAFGANRSNAISPSDVKSFSRSFNHAAHFFGSLSLLIPSLRTRSSCGIRIRIVTWAAEQIGVCLQQLPKEGMKGLDIEQAPAPLLRNCKARCLHNAGDRRTRKAEK